ncbi:sugar phosphate isomerase/epimerase family protein [Gehongia tenuis]|uniref:Sugar phosphate isomerase/epimerase n=1 Tax=Gehongia tenuis TaxID=2763655 RepID=A0A926HPX7_9FIRM|nr:sugar phosphate isomerase/epimerase [Gehongia tenuis]MBC8531648.1 sugar phosphate isomerase/epimerase [Gehongia tenuis]
MKVGIQTYSVRESLTRDPRGTLQKVADMGYKYWETCLLSGLNDDFGLGIPVKEARKFIDDNGVKIVGAHIASRTNLDTLEAMFDYHKELGNDRVGLSAHFFDDRDDLLQKCEKYNEVGEFAKARGMHFYYHNHFHEFQKFDGEYVMDILLANTDPELVSFELDAFWAARGGMDPVELIHKYKDRLILLHQKDFSKTAGEPINLFEKAVDPQKRIDRNVYQNARKDTSFAEVGTGTMDIQSIIDAGNAVGVPYILLEQDFTFLDEIDSIQISMNAFRKFSGIEWA